MNLIRKPILGVVSVMAFLIVAWYAAIPQAQETSPPNPQLEDEIHRAAGALVAGRPAQALPAVSGKLRLSIRDIKDDMPTFCRVNVIGADGQFYEPAENALKPWSLSRLGNRTGKGPFRYYGWFFYCNGQCELTVPAGATRIDVWKGFEYQPVEQSVEVVPGSVSELVIKVARVADMARVGWYSGDTHIHLDRRNADDDERAFDLAAAEDLRFAHILCMNDPRAYQPLMDQQIWHQMQGMGAASERKRGIYTLMSGQEYRSSTYGHMCLIGASRLVDADGLKTDPNRWPVFGMVADEARGINGLAFHAHGGYEQEIYADFAQRATDGVELLQFAEYRGIGLEGWYHILNAGFQFPALGASDYPYCRALGDCRTYAYLLPGGGMKEWNQAVSEGKSFFTTGPLLELYVNEERPGNEVTLSEPDKLNIRIRLQSVVCPVTTLQLLVGGRVHQTWDISKEQFGKPFQIEADLRVVKSTWIAARAFGKSPTGRENTEAHTNPIYVLVANQPIRERTSAEWLLRKLDQQIAIQAGRTFPEREKVLEYYRRSRSVLEKLASE
jgi:hypothetical protein